MFMVYHVKTGQVIFHEVTMPEAQKLAWTMYLRFHANYAIAPNKRGNWVLR